MILLGTISAVADEGDTTVSVDPSSQNVSAGDTFNVNVSCIPGQPVKAFEFRLSFDSSLFQANLVTEGDIFDGYSTFFNYGTIDNNAGTIVDVYNLIIGLGNVSDPGTFVTISFTAKETSDTSSFDIDYVGVTDEAGYIFIDVSDGIIFSPIIPSSEEGNPPDAPAKPYGPTFVEIGVEYAYTSSAVDVDGDQIRYRFDWGDGNYSDWSEFVASNTSVSMSHSWTFISTFEVRAIAQDENGLNSSWSLPINVMALQFDFEGEPPVADFSVPSNASTNQTIVFDASGSFDEDGVIISYLWDFGDGENGSGITPSHVYENPGKYIVTLVVMDNNGNTHSKSIIVTVASEFEEKQSGKDQGALPFDLGNILIGFAMVMLASLAVFFRDDIKSFVSSHARYIHMFSHWKIWDTSNRINRIDAKIEKIEKTRARSVDFKQAPIIKTNEYSYELQEEYLRAGRYIDFNSKSNSEEKKSFDEFNKAYTREKIDKLVRTELEHDKLPAETRDSETLKDLDFRSKIDTLHLSDRKKKLNKFDIEKESMIYESDEIDIERKIDNFLISKTREKIDAL